MRLLLYYFVKIRRLLRVKRKRGILSPACIMRIPDLRQKIIGIQHWQ